MFIWNDELKAIRKTINALAGYGSFFTGDWPILDTDATQVMRRETQRIKQHEALVHKIDALATALGYEFQQREAELVCIKRKGK